MKFAKKAVALLVVSFLFVMTFIPVASAASSDSSGKINPTVEKPLIFKISFTDSEFVPMGDDKVIHQDPAAMFAFKDAVERISGGRIKVEMYMNGKLGDNKSTLEQVLAGTLEASGCADGDLAGFYKNINVFAIPYLFENEAQADAVYDGPVGQKIFADMAKTTGLRVLAQFDNGGFRNFTNNKKPIHSAADMKGLKIRTMNIPAHMDMVKALGATPTPIAWMELYGALQNGVVDGEENSASTFLIGHLNEVQKYMVLDKHFLGSAYIVMSEKLYESLPKDLQIAVDVASHNATIAARGTSRANAALALEAVKKAGVQVYAPTPEEMKTFEAAREPVVEALKKSLDPKLVDEVLAAAEQAKEDQANMGVGGTIVTSNSVATSAPVTSTSSDEPSSSAPASSSNTVIYVLIGAVVVIIIAFFAFRKKK